MKVILAGGGTGGHVMPALAIARELASRYAARCVFVGTPRGIENRLVPAAGFELRLLHVGALKSVSLATRLRTLAGLPWSFVVAARILRDVQPDVVIGVGGYASGPAMLMGALTGRPTLAFEPNVVPGFANRVVASLVSAAAVQFPETARYFRRAELTGIPVRPEFFAIAPDRNVSGPAVALADRGREAAASRSHAGSDDAGRALPSSSAPPAHPDARSAAAGSAFGDTSSAPSRAKASGATLLVFGGSQGSRPLNRAMMAALPLFRERLPGLRIIHQTGEREHHAAQAAYLQAGIPAEVAPFLDRMWDAFAAADLIVCRSGASTVAELTAAGKASILVPFPRAADHHQLRNAEALVARGAALLLPESDLTPDRLVATVADALSDPARLAALGAAAKTMSHPDAAARIAQLAARLAGVSEGAAGA
jgi:UDP-N-acetylglucosamine--N-acetylmuramyl-(pentapeptide) pyrophosphoryl-undecaprenol N-acetylglucosamine transferase